MTQYTLPPHINTNKIFLVNRSEFNDRFDPDIVLYNRKTKSFKYNAVVLKSLLKKSPQYGANESGIERLSLNLPRYIRITDINEYGLLKDDIGVTAEKIEKKYILNTNDLLFARSGATVGKAYLHSKEKIDYDCFFAGYMIRFVVNEELIIPQYLFVYTQLSPYKEWVKSIQRTAGQPNINAEEYKSLLIPLPTKDVQKDIVSIIEKAYLIKQQKESEAKALLDSIDDYLLGELGISLPDKTETKAEDIPSWMNAENPLVKNGRLFLTSFKEVEGGRLDPKPYDINTRKLKQAIANSTAPLAPLSSIITHSCAGDWGLDETETYENQEYQKCLVIRATEFDNKYNLNLDNTRVKYRLIKQSKLARIDIQTNDLLIEKSGGSPDQPVGRIAILSKEVLNNQSHIGYSNFIHKIRIDLSKANPEYVYCFLKTMHNIKITETMQSQTNGIRNLIMHNYLAQNIPLPEQEKQENIIQTISSIRNKAFQLQEEATQILLQEKYQVEQMILGE